MPISHEEQQKIWEEEHRNPYLLPPMDSKEPSGGLVRFWNWLKRNATMSDLSGIEMGCGKGRNCIWLAEQGVKMAGFDFATSAIKEAEGRAAEKGVKNIKFLLYDATQTWPFPENSFDIAIDNFVTSDIETAEGRAFARDEFRRVLKVGGYLYVSALSHEDMIYRRELTDDLNEKNSYVYKETGKFEKAFDETELFAFYNDFKLVRKDRVRKTVAFFGKDYYCETYESIFQKI